MHLQSCALACLLALAAGGLFAPNLALGQDGKKDKGPPEKDPTALEARTIQKTAEKVAKGEDGIDPRLADKLFREFDRDRNGHLEPAEWPGGLAARARWADADQDGRVSPDEYRRYFDGEVAFAVAGAPPPKPDKRDKPAAPPAAPKAEEPAEEPKPVAVRPGKLPAGLPKWFEELDADRDAQVGLYEWRKAGKDLAEFLAMDLNGDGLLPPDEYLRHVRERRRDGATDPDAPVAGKR
ncbi:MAG: hypothetical protein C0501_22355 [Isosphaera sp.]|nr:hypothetical protein [Isosphaera sp.]